MESTLHIGLQGSQEDPPYGASGSPCCLVPQRGTHACSPFQCCPGNSPPLRGLPLEPTPRGSQPHSTACYEMATVFLHPVERQALLPSGYPAASSYVEPQAPLPAGYFVNYTNLLLFILFLTPVVLLFTLSSLFAEPRVGKA